MKKGLLERLAEGPILGDGGFTFGLEKRGYVRGGAWTPECTVLHPEAVKQYHREFLRGGAEVMQAFNFYSTEDKVETISDLAKAPSSEEINRSACRIAREVADEGEALVSASISETASYREKKGKAVVVDQFTKQAEFLKTCPIDFIICEYFGHIEEMEWAIAVAKTLNKPVVASMCIGPNHDLNGVPTGECAVRMAKAGADVVGINCNFGPNVVLTSMRVVKDALDKAGLSPYLICQPLGYFTPECAANEGYLTLPEAPFGLDSRIINRFEAMNYAREAYEIGVRYIGGCCGFEPYHIRAMAEELVEERGGRLPEVSREQGLIVDGLKKNLRGHIKERSTLDYWKKLKPATGRPCCAAFSCPMHS